MKILLFLLLALSPMFAQGTGSVLISRYTGLISDNSNTLDPDVFSLVVKDYLTYSVWRNPDGSKTLVFAVTHCLSPSIRPETLEELFITEKIGATTCGTLKQSFAVALGPVQEVIAQFLDYAPNARHRLVYKLSREALPGKALQPRAAGAQPADAADPQMVILDTESDNRILKLDLTTFATSSQVLLPNQSPRVFGMRPSATGDTNEVWTAPGPAGSAITISDLGAGKVTGAIPNPTTDPTKNNSAGIVFTNDGSTALYAVGYTTPDSSGNNGALLAIDAVNRKITSTLPLKFAPQQLLMSPDGLTAYIIGSQAGMISYYDVLSGTADLTARIASFNGPAFIHPDGTRLFWDAGQLEVFDLTTRKIVNEFKFGLPTTSATSIGMSQDGSQVYAGNGLGAVVILDTRSGQVVATYQEPGAALVFSGPPAN
jgi:hypothetical protein